MKNIYPLNSRFTLPFAFVLAVSLLVVSLMFMLPGGSLHAQTSDDKIEYAENGTGSVAAFTATDPENAGDITWSLLTNVPDDDKDDFTMDGGVLSFKKSPNFEMPTGGGPEGTSTTYTVTVVATDADFQTTRKEVTIEVTNVEEAGTVSLTSMMSVMIDGSTDTIPVMALSPHPGVLIQAELSDPDERERNLDWQWSRSSSRTGSYSNIADADTMMYRPTANDVGYYLRVTVSYKDGEGTGKSAMATSMHPVQAIRSPNAAPQFPDEDPDTAGIQNETATRMVIENAEAGANVGAALRAADANNDILTHTLTGTDAGSFKIDPATGQITVGADTDIDAENANENAAFAVDVVATDPDGMSAAIRVTITALDDEDEPPAIAGDMTKNVAENETDLEIDDYGATDPDPDTPPAISWSLSGDDARDFEITAQGALSLKESPNYERPADADMDNVYKVTVQAADSVGNRGERDVEVTVTNTDEPGAVALSSVQARVGVPITATLSDPDGGVTNVTWQWNVGAADIANATSATFTPGAAQQGDILTVTASYTDAHGPDKTAPATTSAVALDTRNRAPVFDDQDTDTDGTQNTAAVRSVPENTKANGTDDPADATDNADDNNDGGLDNDNVGAPITATDPNNPEDGDVEDQTTYSLSGTDAGSFRLRAGGQIEVAAGTSLDYETKRTYSVTLTATDSFGLSDSIAVTINVTDLNEGPAVTGPSEVDYAENGTGAAAVFRATDPENAGAIAWSLQTGDDAEDFMIDGGTLSFSKSPDYESPADSDTNNIYIVTVMATDADFRPTTKEVTITVTNADEAGTVSLTSSVTVDGSPVAVTALAPHPGTIITAALSDEDGRARNDKWQWSRSTTRSGSFINIANASTNMYDPTTNDVGYYLRATVAYDDREGDSKSAMASSVRPVQVIRSPNAGPAFLDEDPDMIGVQNTEAARMVLENAEAGANVGAPVRAADANNDILTYALTGAASARFKVDSASGQITVGAGAMLNAETDASAITGKVVAVDPAGMFTSIDVSITVTDDSDEPPAISATVNGSPLGRVVTVEENLTNLQIVDFEAVDPDPDDGDNPLSWSLSGDDASDFEINDQGRLSFEAAPNYESPADADTNNVYMVTVQAADPSRNRGEKEIEVRVTNMEEPGAVALSSVQARVGVPITATLSDSDGGVTNVTWQWERAGTAIDRATSATYTPVGDDSGQALTAMASYTDAQGLGKTAESAPGLTVAADTRNKPPVFGDQDGDTPGTQNTEAARSIPENTKANSADDTDDTDSADDNVGEVLAATDSNTGDSLTYTLSGSDAGSFRVRNNNNNGQIEVAAGASLDYETKDTYNITLTATDSFGLTASIAVTINVTDLNEGPVIMVGSGTAGLAISGPSSRNYAENGTGAVATYRLTGANAASATWSVEGADAGDFTINGGTLRFVSSPDYEMPDDTNGDNTYMVTVKATSGTDMDTHEVTVTVTNEDDAIVERDLLDMYDGDDSGHIDRAEAVQAVLDYQRGQLTRAETVQVILLYQAGPQ